MATELLANLERYVEFRGHLPAGHGILKVAKLVGVGSSTVQRVWREMASPA